MVHVHTLVQVVDNSGAVFLQSIRLLRGSQKTRASVGNYIVGSVKKIATNRLQKKNKAKKTISSGDVCKALIVCTSTRKSRFGSFYVKADKNSVILVADNFSPLANRIIGPVFYELRGSKQMKVLSLADFVI